MMAARTNQINVCDRRSLGGEKKRTHTTVNEIRPCLIRSAFNATAGTAKETDIDHSDW
jgi:hypothetical protein